MPVTRNIARLNYKLFNEYGLDQMPQLDEDVLEVSDPTSNIFDNEDEVVAIEQQIQDLEISISEKERALKRTDYEKQGAIPKSHCVKPDKQDKAQKERKTEKKKSKKKTETSDTKVKDSSAPEFKERLRKQKEKVVNSKKSSTPVHNSDAEPSCSKKEDADKRKSTTKKSRKGKKGEINLEKLRKKKALSRLVEKQLSKILKHSNFIDLEENSEFSSDSSDDDSDFSVNSLPLGRKSKDYSSDSDSSIFFIEFRF